MEPNFMSSIIGIALFTLLMVFALRFASGKWAVNEGKKATYNGWVQKHGKTVKRAIIIASVVFYVGMLLQLSSFL
jgi:isoprenylcysteine carboxyl methyltransferase (ICMT) family protein YpbQ